MTLGEGSQPTIGQKRLYNENKSMDKVYTTKNTSLELKDVDTEKGNRCWLLLSL